MKNLLNKLFTSESFSLRSVHRSVLAVQQKGEKISAAEWSEMYNLPRTASYEALRSAHKVGLGAYTRGYLTWTPEFVKFAEYLEEDNSPQE